MRARYPLVRIGRGKRPFPPFSTKSAENLLPFFLLQRIRRGGKRRGAASPRAGKERGEESARKGPRRSRQAFLAQFLASLQTPPGRREVRGSRRIHNPLKRLHSPVGSSPPPPSPPPPSPPRPSFSLFLAVIRVPHRPNVNLTSASHPHLRSPRVACLLATAADASAQSISRVIFRSSILAV